MYDIYNPPPAPVAWNPPQAERLFYTRGDLTCLATLCVSLFAASILVWRSEPTVAFITALGGAS